MIYVHILTISKRMKYNEFVFNDFELSIGHKNPQVKTCLQGYSYLLGNRLLLGNERLRLRQTTTDSAKCGLYCYKRFGAAILLELLTFSLSVLFMLVGSEHTGTAMVYPRFYREHNGVSAEQLERADEIVDG